MNVVSITAVSAVLCALTTGLVGCTSPGLAAVGAAKSCPVISGKPSAQEWAPADETPQGLREVCLDETDAFAAEIPDEKPQFPATVTGADGVRVDVTHADRVLALDISGSLASTVVALGAGDQLVGRDTATSEQALQQLPVVTSESHILNVDSILATKPDVILTDGSLGPRRALEQLRDIGISVVVVESSRGISEDHKRITCVAETLGLPASGHALSAALHAEITSLTQHISDATAGITKPKVVFLYLRGSAQVYYVLGEESGVSDLIEAAGGIDVAREQGIRDAVPLTSEALLALQPDVVMTMTTGLASVGGVEGLLELIPQLSGVRALSEKNVIVVPDAYVVRFSTYSPATIRALAGALFGVAS